MQRCGAAVLTPKRVCGLAGVQACPDEFGAAAVAPSGRAGGYRMARRPALQLSDPYRPARLRAVLGRVPVPAC